MKSSFQSSHVVRLHSAALFGCRLIEYDDEGQGMVHGNSRKLPLVEREIHEGRGSFRGSRKKLLWESDRSCEKSRRREEVPLALTCVSVRPARGGTLVPNVNRRNLDYARTFYLLTVQPIRKSQGLSRTTRNGVSAMSIRFLMPQKWIPCAYCNCPSGRRDSSHTTRVSLYGFVG